MTDGGPTFPLKQKITTETKTLMSLFLQIVQLCEDENADLSNVVSFKGVEENPGDGAQPTAQTPSTAKRLQALRGYRGKVDNCSSLDELLGVTSDFCKAGSVILKYANYADTQSVYFDTSTMELLVNPTTEQLQYPVLSMEMRLRVQDFNDVCRNLKGLYRQARETEASREDDFGEELFRSIVKEFRDTRETGKLQLGDLLTIAIKLDQESKLRNHPWLLKQRRELSLPGLTWTEAAKNRTTRTRLGTKIGKVRH